MLSTQTCFLATCRSRSSSLCLSRSFMAVTSCSSYTAVFDPFITILPYFGLRTIHPSVLYLEFASGPVGDLTYLLRRLLKAGQTHRGLKQALPSSSLPCGA